MTDNFEEENRTPKAESEPKTPTMAETEERLQDVDVVQKLEKPQTLTMAETEERPQAVDVQKLEKSFSIWPPSQRTRDAVTNRLIQTLSAPSVLSKRYGEIPEAEATAAARRIEDEAFSTTAASASADDDGIEILQAYSKEISKRMLEIVKSRSGSASESAPEEAAVSTAEVSSGNSEAN